jgi:hypothetical protein
MPFFQSSGSRPRVDCCRNEALALGQTSNGLSDKIYGLLQTRTKVLNNELEAVFRRWYPRFRSAV